MPDDLTLSDAETTLIEALRQIPQNTQSAISDLTEALASDQGPTPDVQVALNDLIQAIHAQSGAGDLGATTTSAHSRAKKPKAGEEAESA